MNILGEFRYANEDARMKALRVEEAELGIQPLEYVSNALLTARLVRVDSTPVREMPGEAVGQTLAAKDAHQEPSHSPDIGESGLHELIEFASLAKVMG